MGGSFIVEFINIVKKYAPNCFINSGNELIIEPKNNIYFKLDDVKTELDLKYKVIVWLSRPSCKCVSRYWQDRIRCIVNDFLTTDFSKDDMRLIYSYLGNGCNRSKTIEFIESGYNLNIILD